MHHGVEGGTLPSARLDAENAAAVAATLHALSSRGRLLILAWLQHGPMSVTPLAEATGMKQPVVSAHLGLLRGVGMVTSARRGRKVIYSLTDNHVVQFLDEVVCYTEHVRLNVASHPGVGE